MSLLEWLLRVAFTSLFWDRLKSKDKKDTWEIIELIIIPLFIPISVYLVFWGHNRFTTNPEEVISIAIISLKVYFLIFVLRALLHQELGIFPYKKSIFLSIIFMSAISIFVFSFLNGIEGNLYSFLSTLFTSLAASIFWGFLLVSILGDCVMGYDFIKNMNRPNF